MRTPVPLATVAVLAFAVSACGSTRFVVVDSQTPRVPVAAAGATGATGAAGSAASPGPASAADLTAIKQVVGDVFSTDEQPLAARLARVIDGDDLGPTVTAVLKLVKATGATVTVNAATVTGDKATATVSVDVGDKPFASDVPVEVVRSGDEWKVTRGGACAVLSLGSPCPDKATG